MEIIMCKHCKKREIFYPISHNYCEHCLENRRKANKKYDESHRHENYLRTKEWIKNNPHEAKKLQKHYRDAHKEAINESKKRWKSSEAGKKSYKKYREKNKEKLNSVSCVWQKANKEKRKEYIQLWRSNHAVECREYSRKFRSKDVGLTRERAVKYSHDRRCRKNNNGGSYTVEEWNDLLNRFGNMCLCCGSKENISVDHIIPISIGGTNSIDNIQPLCMSCNMKKRTKIIDYRNMEAGE